MLNIFSEGMSLGQKAGLNGNQILEIIDAGAIANPMFKGKGAYAVKRGLQHKLSPLNTCKKDIRLAVALGDQLEQPLPTAAAAK